jgi:hypothetical protein
MGLLDDAIREHLELKRLRGADPGVVAREEQAALSPVPRQGDAANADEADNRPGLATHGDESLSAPGPPLTADSANSELVGQETVEINMEAELASEDNFHPAADRDTDSRPAAHPANAGTISDESLEWEVPSEAEAPAGRVELDEDNGSGTDENLNQAEPVEDVLEETPDFLSETPEQERLWFEQRPPRDFDFNE